MHGRVLEGLFFLLLVGVCALVMDDGRSGNDERRIDDEMGVFSGAGLSRGLTLLSSRLLLLALLGLHILLCACTLYTHSV